MSAWAKPGVRCVCVLPCVNFATLRDEGYVAVGGIYKIVSVTPCETVIGPRVGLGIWGTPLDLLFDVQAFRPLITLTDDAAKDTALFLDIAGHVPAPEKEAAE